MKTPVKSHLITMPPTVDNLSYILLSERYGLPELRLIVCNFDDIMIEQPTNERTGTNEFQNDIHINVSNFMLHNRASLFAETIKITSFSDVQEQLKKNVHIDEKDLEKLGN